MTENKNIDEQQSKSETELVSAQLIENQQNQEQKKEIRDEIKKKDKMSSKLITCLVLFIIPIFGPIIFLSVIKPQDKVIKILTIISIIPGLNIIFLFFLLGFYKESFWEKNLY